MQSITALMLESKNGKKFFVRKSCLKKMTEFAKAFKLKIYLINTKYKKLFDCEQFVEKFCDQNYSHPEIEYSIVSTTINEQKMILSKKGSKISN